MTKEVYNQTDKHLDIHVFICQLQIPSIRPVVVVYIISTRPFIYNTFLAKHVSGGGGGGGGGPKSKSNTGVLRC